jgi:hypothetical protein
MSNRCLAVEQLAPTTSTPLSMNNAGLIGMTHCDVFVEGADIRWTERDDDTLSSSVGTRLGDGKVHRFDGDFAKWRCIALSGSPVVRVHKYSGLVS